MACAPILGAPRSPTEAWLLPGPAQPGAHLREPTWSSAAAAGAPGGQGRRVRGGVLGQRPPAWLEPLPSFSGNS